MITAKKHHPKVSRADRLDLEAKRRLLDRERRTPLNLLEHIGEEMAERRERRAVAACYDPRVHETPVKVFDPRTARA